MAHPLEWFDSISRTLRWNTRAAEQKGWTGGSLPASHDPDQPQGEYADPDEEPDFDIDFEDDDGAVSTKDSGFQYDFQTAAGAKKAPVGELGSPVAETIVEPAPIAV